MNRLWLECKAVSTLAVEVGAASTEIESVGSTPADLAAHQVGSRHEQTQTSILAKAMIERTPETGAVPDGASIPIAHMTRGTAVGLSSQTEVRPESSIDFAIHASRATRASVALVDEGVLNLTRHTDPDPLAFFVARRRLNSRGADIGRYLMTRVRFLPGVQTGGDGGLGLSVPLEVPAQ